MMVRFYRISAIILAFLLIWCQSPNTKIGTLSVEEVKQKIEAGEDIVFWDVRTSEEYDGPFGHIPGSMLLPLQELEARLHELEDLKEKEIIVYCRTQNRSGTAVDILRKHGFKNVTNMIGGMIIWQEMSAGADN